MNSGIAGTFVHEEAWSADETLCGVAVIADETPLFEGVVADLTVSRLVHEIAFLAKRAVQSGVLEGLSLDQDVWVNKHQSSSVKPRIYKGYLEIGYIYRLCTAKVQTVTSKRAHSVNFYIYHLKHN